MNVDVCDYASASGVLFLTSGMLMGTHTRRIQHDPLKVRVLEYAEETIPDAVVGPSAKPSVDRVPVTEVFRQVTPGCSGAVNPEYGVDKAAIVASGDASIRGFAGEQVFDASELFIGDVVAGHGFFARRSFIATTQSIVHAL